MTVTAIRVKFAMRLGITVLFSMAMGLAVLADEIVLKNGIKIIGRTKGIDTHKIEVGTSHGTIKLKRSNVASINLSDNNVDGATAIHANAGKLSEMSEMLDGTTYVNRVGNFSLTLPPGWSIDRDLIHSPLTLAGLVSKDQRLFAVVVQEEYSGSLDSYKQLTLLHVQHTLDEFEALSELKSTIDGTEARLVFYRGIVSGSNELPVEFLSAILKSGNTFVKITTWCIEPLFNDTQHLFEGIVYSFRRVGPVAPTVP